MNEGTKPSTKGPQSQDKKNQNNKKCWKKRGNNNNHHRKPNNHAGRNNSQRNKSKQNQFIDVYTSDFQAMHKKCLQMGFGLPIKYKVHKPKSSALIHKLEQGTLRYVEEEDPKSSTSPSKSNITIVDGMMVRPDTKRLPCVFLGKDTSLSEFVQNPRGTERKLQEQMDASFSSTNVGKEDDMEGITRGMASLSTTTTTTTGTNLPTGDATIMKFACAADLLEEEPNGFACVASSSEEIIEKVRDWTRTLASNVEHKATDHGDFVVSMPRELLWEFLQATQADKQQSRKGNAIKPPTSTIRPLPLVQDDILSRMRQQGVDPSIKKDGTKIKFGHHLESLMQLMMQNPSTTNGNGKSKKNSSNKNTQDAKNPSKDPKSSNHKDTTGDEDYMLIYGFDDSSEEGGPKLELNIPGGKRALGETSVQAAMRETEEETSLKWTEDWITKVYQNKNDPSLKMNRYFLLNPPDLENLKV